MVKRRKILEKIVAGSKNVRFDEFAALLEGFGFVLKRIAGSHHIYKHPDIPEVFSAQPDKNNQAKPYQMRKLLKLVEEYDLILHEEEE